MEHHLKIIGFFLVTLALLHFFFPKYFNWEQELKSLNIINRQMMYVHSFFIALTIFFMGLLCITSSNDLLYTPLGKRISLGLGIFWSLRLIVQVFVYSAKNWKGKTFETIIHFLFVVLWTYLSIVFVLTYLA